MVDLEVRARKPSRSPGEWKILSALRGGDKSFTMLKSETGLPGSVLSDYLKRLQRDGLIERDFETRRYRIKEAGIVFEIGRAIESWPGFMTFTLVPSEVHIIDEKKALIGGRIDILNYAATASVHYKGGKDALAELFGRRFGKAPHKLLQGILAMIREKGVLDEGYFAGKKSFQDISPEKWDDIFKKLFWLSEEVIYVERVRVKPLLRFMKTPQTGEWLNALVKKAVESL